MKNLLLLLTLLTSSVYANSLTKEEFKKAMGFFNSEIIDALEESQNFHNQGQTYLMNMKSCEVLQLHKAKIKVAEENIQHYKTDYAFQKELSQNKSYISAMGSALKQIGFNCD